MALRLIESTLAQIYKKQGPTHSYGGPALLHSDGAWLRTGSPRSSRRFYLTYMGGFNPLASFNVADAFTHYSWRMSGRRGLSAPSSVLMAGSIFGGTRVSPTSLPCFAGYGHHLPVGLVVVALNYQNIPAMFSAIFAGA